MSWDTVWNISKLVGVLLAAAGFVTLIAKVWSSTTKDKIICLLETELDLARAHAEQCDGTVQHYRTEMHDTRKECTGKVTVAQDALEAAQHKLKMVEIKNARLLAQTDLTPVMQVLTSFIKEQRSLTEEQTAINAQILSALQQLNAKLA